MKNLVTSPVTEQSEQATAYVAEERINIGIQPQYSAMTDNDLVFTCLLFLTYKNYERE